MNKNLRSDAVKACYVIADVNHKVYSRRLQQLICIMFVGENLNERDR